MDPGSTGKPTRADNLLLCPQNTPDTHNEPFRARVWPVPDNLYVVVRHGRNHNSPVHSSAQGPPRGLCLAIRREIHQVKQRPILQAIQPAKQRRIRLPKRLLKRRAIQRRIRLAIQVTIQVAIHAQTPVRTQRATQVSIRRTIRREIRGEIRRETQGVSRRAFTAALSREFPVPSLQWRKAELEFTTRTQRGFGTGVPDIPECADSLERPPQRRRRILGDMKLTPKRCWGSVCPWSQTDRKPGPQFPVRSMSRSFSARATPRVTSSQPQAVD
jgi:hypothetical protein